MVPFFPFCGRVLIVKVEHAEKGCPHCYGVAGEPSYLVLRASAMESRGVAQVGDALHPFFRREGL